MGQTRNYNPSQHIMYKSQSDEDVKRSFHDMKAPRVVGEMKMLEPGYQPGPKDAICSRGKAAFEHNVHFRKVIQEHLPMYSEAYTKLAKSLIVTEVVETIRRGSPRGGFVRKVDGKWVEVGDTIAREKIGGAFREMLHYKYQSSSKSKKRRRKEESEAVQKRDGNAASEGNGAPPPATVLALDTTGHQFLPGNLEPRPIRRNADSVSGTRIQPRNALFAPILQDISCRIRELADGQAETKLEELPVEPRLLEPLAFPPTGNWFDFHRNSPDPDESATYS